MIDAGSTSPAPPAYLWFTHQPGSVRWLKSELARLHPELRFSFSRPGLSTFRVDAATKLPPGVLPWNERVLARLRGPFDPEHACPSHVALAWGLSIGTLKEVRELHTLLGPGLLEGAAAEDLRPCLHVFERPGKRPVDEEDASVRGRHAHAVRDSILSAYPATFDGSPHARLGQLVVDIITPHASEPSEAPFVGVHRHHGLRGPMPGGCAPAVAPAYAPSRAYAKIVEAIAFAALDVRSGETALEIGCAPGGAVLALLERGLDVVGIDPGEMAAVLQSEFPTAGRRGRLTHLKKPAAEVLRDELPQAVHWIALDVNMAPMAALKYVERFAAIFRSTLRGVILTLKIHDDGVLEALPGLRERIRKLGLDWVAITQLPSHRHEVVAIGRRGTAQS